MCNSSKLNKISVAPPYKASVQTREWGTRCESKTTILMSEQVGKVCERETRVESLGLIVQGEAMDFLKLYGYFHNFTSIC